MKKMADVILITNYESVTIGRNRKERTREWR